MKEAPNYTNAALVMGGVNLLWVFMVIWATLGFLAVLVAGFALDKLILWCARRRTGRTAGG
ncbi:hypothetical protein [uncultured Roseovarius sp.]|uniref:hypothetical protein n=1 Tax=uncultured Roseovarius sp. TaxID=293344 RepID=UPI002613A69B|nr:hypothetical protein [uncultured Roseovarius sp.]